MNMPILFMGSPEFALPSLQIFEAAFKENLHVITQPDKAKGRKQILQPTPIKKYCLEKQIPCYCPTDKATLIESVKRIQPCCIVVVAYGKLLPQEIIDTYLCLNVHPSLLPLYRGPSPLQAPLLNGDSHTGVSIIKLVKAMDAGPIAAQEKIDIQPEDTAASLHDQLGKLGAQLLLKCTQDYLKDAKSLIFKTQDESKASLCPLIRTADAELLVTDSALQKWHKIRAYNPKPGAYIMQNNQRIKIFKANLENGQIIPVEIQVEGKQKMAYDEYLKGGQEIAL